MNPTPSRPLIWALILLLAGLGLSAPPRAIGAPKPAPASPQPETTPAPNPEPSAAPSPAGNDTADREEKLNNAVQAMGSIQSLLEFYFMETGSYPDALEDMLSQYNQGKKQNEPMVKVPTDPATGKRFVYKPNKDKNRYVVKVPEPAAYGLASLEVHQVDWGWMAGIAAEAKMKRQTLLCARYMQLVDDTVEQYNKANRNRYPETLDQLIPKFLQKLPSCPLTNKPYIYTHTDRSFEIKCPDPKAHNLEKFEFSSTDGLRRQP